MTVAPLPPSVLERIRIQARRQPDAVALRRCDGTSVLRYKDLIREADRVAADLRDCGVVAGGRVAVLSDNGPETYLSVLACAKLGAIAVLVDGSLPVATVDRFCQITDPGAILIAPGCPLDPTALTVAVGARPCRSVEIHPGTNSFEESVVPPSLGAEDPLAMIFTSGTTGDPKAVLLANRTFYAVADILRKTQLPWISWVAGEATYSPLPATHIGGLWWILNCLMQGSECVTGGENTTSLLDLLTANNVATTCLVPTLLARLVAELKSTGGAPPPSLRLVGYGGSRAIAADVSHIEAAGVHTAQVYGLSETGCTALCLPSEEGSIDRIEAGAVGRPYPGVEVHLDPDESGPPSGPEADSTATSGTLWIKSPANMLGYWNNTERTAEVLVDGWVNTGDLLELGGDGYFYIRGRSSEMIISGGVNIAPDEVDRIAESVSGVQEAACYEIADAEFGALVGLALVPSSGLDEHAARALKHAVAATYRRESESMARPVRIDIVTQIPRTQSGKIMRTSLAAAVRGDETAGP